LALELFVLGKYDVFLDVKVWMNVASTGSLVLYYSLYSLLFACWFEKFVFK